MKGMKMGEEARMSFRTFMLFMPFMVKTNCIAPLSAAPSNGSAD